jgi:hypothetical protein
VSATIYLETVPGGTLDLPKVLSVPELSIGDPISLTTSLAWPAPDHDLYRLVMELDEVDSLVEQDEDNNRRELAIPVVLRATLTPTTTTVITSVSGAVQLIFPAGLVTTPTEVVYTPFWPVGTVTGSLKTSTVAFSLTTMLDGQPTPLTPALPLSVTWRYDEADLVGLDEEHLRLFVRATGGRWHDAACQPYQRDLTGNQLTAFVCRIGQFVFGNRHDVYLPLIRRGELPMASFETNLPRSPLRLPPRE